MILGGILEISRLICTERDTLCFVFSVRVTSLLLTGLMTVSFLECAAVIAVVVAVVESVLCVLTELLDKCCNFQIEIVVQDEDDESR